MAHHPADRLVLLLPLIKINFVRVLIAISISISDYSIKDSVWFVANISAIHYCR